MVSFTLQFVLFKDLYDLIIYYLSSWFLSISVSDSNNRYWTYIIQVEIRQVIVIRIIIDCTNVKYTHDNIAAKNYNSTGKGDKYLFFRKMQKPSYCKWIMKNLKINNSQLLLSSNFKFMHFWQYEYNRKTGYAYFSSVKIDIDRTFDSEFGSNCYKIVTEKYMRNYYQ